MSDWHLADLKPADYAAIRDLERRLGLILIAWEQGLPAPGPGPGKECATEMAPPDPAVLATLNETYRSGEATDNATAGVSPAVPAGAGNSTEPPTTAARPGHGGRKQAPASMFSDAF